MSQKADLYYITPYILFFFGVIMSIIGVLIKMAINNMQKSIDVAIETVKEQGIIISDLVLAKELHKMRLESHAAEISYLRSKLESGHKTEKAKQNQF